MLPDGRHAEDGKHAGRVQRGVCLQPGHAGGDRPTFDRPTAQQTGTRFFLGHPIQLHRNQR